MMKKCLMMFVFFVVMLAIAAITDVETMLSENNTVSYADTEKRLTSKEIDTTKNK
jgi:hypothetical protein